MAKPTRDQLEKLSYQEMVEVQADLKQLIQSAEVEERQKVKESVLAMVQASGFDIADLFGNAVAGAKGKSAGRPKSNGEPKYRHPENPELTWTGRGRQPVWIKEHEEAGKSKEDFLIDK